MEKSGKVTSMSAKVDIDGETDCKARVLNGVDLTCCTIAWSGFRNGHDVTLALDKILPVTFLPWSFSLER